ncbi:hypothetical protein [Paludisphaera mucosa]|uniref:Major facilitator superfamily (MFS) profile domain-containing protein n=1 Tax=Paludisphaera mucosa TaxID=3030827 RepID=A0ABT6F3S3_9BACT|nr:hypothetical protein [Paludisphaera mucosa]MDG3002235.1 hypothetical protein [Paludisphaera mucosa]
MGAVILRGRERRWWAGFAFLGSGYLMLASAPWFADEFGSRLITTKVLMSFYNGFLAPSPVFRQPPILW